MLTIETRYLPHTDYREARISAQTTTPRPSTGRRERLTIPRDGLATPDWHRRAAEALARRAGWAGEWRLFGETERGYLFGRVTVEFESFVIERWIIVSNGAADGRRYWDGHGFRRTQAEALVFPSRVDAAARLAAMQLGATPANLWFNASVLEESDL